MVKLFSLEIMGESNYLHWILMFHLFQ